MANFATSFETPVTAGEAFERAGLAFKVEPQRLTLPDGRVAARVAQCRDDSGEILGYSAPGYVATQPADVVRMIESTAGAAGMSPRCVRLAGIHKGKLCVGIELPEGGSVIQRTRTVGDGRADRLETFAFLGTDWDGEQSLFVRLQTHRPWCSNQYASAALSAQIRVRHNRQHGFGVESACQLLATAPTYAEQVAERAQLMASTPLAPGALRDTVGRIALAEITGDFEAVAAHAGGLDAVVAQTLGEDDTPRRMNRYRETATEMRRLACVGAGNDGSTYWDVLNGVSDYVDHTRPERRGSSRQAQALMGVGATFKAQAEIFVFERARAVQGARA